MIQKLISKIEENTCTIVVGLDPMLNYTQNRFRKKAFKEYGETLKGAGEAIWQYNKEIIDHVYDLIPGGETADRHVRAVRYRRSHRLQEDRRLL